MKISQRISKVLCRHNVQTEILKGNNSIKNVDGVMVLVLCSLPDGALYLYQVI